MAPSLDQVLADRPIGAAVLVGIADARGLAGGQAHLTRALDLQEESIDRIVDPEQLELASGKRTAVDRGAIGIGDELALLDPATDPATLELGIELAQIDTDQIGRAPIQRIAVRGVGCPRALQKRLVVAGEQAIAIAVVAHCERLEAGLEEAPGPDRPGGLGADGAPVLDRPGKAVLATHGLVGGLLGPPSTTAPERSQRRLRVVVRPSGQIDEIDRGEGQLRRWRWGFGRLLLLGTTAEQTQAEKEEIEATHSACVRTTHPSRPAASSDRANACRARTSRGRPRCRSGVGRPRPRRRRCRGSG